MSKRGEYALRALIDFGVAQAIGRPLLQVSELASKEGLPIKFLEQILMQLKAAGYLESKRGKHGGYLLARPPENITAHDLLCAARSLCQVPPELAKETAHVQTYPISEAVKKLDDLEESWARSNALPALAGDTPEKSPEPAPPQ